MRTARAVDAPSIVAALNDRAVSRPTLRIPYPYTMKHATWWVRRNPPMVRSGKALSLLVFARKDDGLLGAIALREFDWTDRHATLGYWFARKHWGKGYASEAVSTVCQVGFRRLGLHRIEAEVFPFNTASARVLAHVGFVKEGTKRQVARKGARWIDSDVFGLLTRDFRPYVLGERR